MSVACSIRGCKRPAKAKGLCAVCYKRAWRARGGSAVARERAQKRTVERRARQRQENREARRRGTCTTCGDPMGVGVRDDGVCTRCKRIAKEQKWHRVQVMFLDGVPVRIIAERMGWSLGMIAVEMNRMRSEGWNLPYRYKMDGNKRVAA